MIIQIAPVMLRILLQSLFQRNCLFFHQECLSISSFTWFYRLTVSWTLWTASHHSLTQLIDVIALTFTLKTTTTQVGTMLVTVNNTCIKHYLYPVNHTQTKCYCALSRCNSIWLWTIRCHLLTLSFIMTRHMVLSNRDHQPRRRKDLPANQ